MTNPVAAARHGLPWPGRWTAELASCTAAFAVRNFRFRTVTGRIPVTMAEITVAPDGQPTSVRATLGPRSIDTGHRRRDRDLRGPRFLDTGRWPAMAFAASDIRPHRDGWTVHGTLTVKDTACPVRLDVAAPYPPRPDPGRPVELRAAAEFDRRAAGVTTGPGFLIGHQISVSLSVRLRPPG